MFYFYSRPFADVRVVSFITQYGLKRVNDYIFVSDEARLTLLEDNVRGKESYMELETVDSRMVDACFRLGFVLGNYCVVRTKCVPVKFEPFDDGVRFKIFIPDSGIILTDPDAIEILKKCWYL